MDLRTILRSAMPTPDWADVARDGILVACFATRDWRLRLGREGVFDNAIDGILDAAERNRVERRRRREDREEVAFAYACHRVLLSVVLGRPAVEVPLMRDELGCPRLADGAAHTSLSHADGLVAVAIAKAGPVGVDIEPSHRVGAMQEISGRIAHPREQAALSMLPLRDRNAALLALWVRKEALLKAAGIGLAQEMNEFEAPAGGAIELPGGVGGTAVIRMLESDGNSFAAIAGPGECAVHCAWLRPPA